MTLYVNVRTIYLARRKPDTKEVFYKAVTPGGAPVFILVKKKGTYICAINLQDVAEIHRNAEEKILYVQFLTGNRLVRMPGLTAKEIEFVFAQISAAQIKDL